jgi:hypothetical protein
MTTYLIPEIATLSGLSVSTIRRDIRSEYLTCNASLEYGTDDIEMWLRVRRMRCDGITIQAKTWLDQTEKENIIL